LNITDKAGKSPQRNWKSYK